MDVTRRPSDTWIIDFGWTMSEREASYYAAPYAYVAQHVRPVRAENKREAYAKTWWRHVEPRPGMHAALKTFSSFIVTPTISKHRIFGWMEASTLPDHQLIAIVSSDSGMLGFLHSRLHEVWALGLGTWLGFGNDPRYTPSTAFETFPFPVKTVAACSNFDWGAVAGAARDLVAKRDYWLNPPELVDVVPEVVPGFPDRIIPKSEAAATILRKRTLTALYNTRGTPEGAWLDRLHRDLDEAVAAAYGWPADLPDDEILARLLKLNHERAAAEAVQDMAKAASQTRVLRTARAKPKQAIQA